MDNNKKPIKHIAFPKELLRDYREKLIYEQDLEAAKKQKEEKLKKNEKKK